MCVVFHEFFMRDVDTSDMQLDTSFLLHFVGSIFFSIFAYKFWGGNGTGTVLCIFVWPHPQAALEKIFFVDVTFWLHPWFVAGNFVFISAFISLIVYVLDANVVRRQSLSLVAVLRQCLLRSEL